MSILKIRTFPDPVLRENAREVDAVDREVRKLMDDMLDTMYDAPGIGLAATQVGVPQRVIVVDVSFQEDPGGIILLANPVITSSEGEEELEEGCLSVPDLKASVSRYNMVTVEGLDQNGKLRTIQAEGLLARALQHEIDHINGTLILDHLKGVKKELTRKKLIKKAKNRTP
jgi:peptide deformylase